MINFIVGAMMGDFIHQLYAVKNICLQKNDKGNLYITDGHGSDVWTFGLEKAFQDLYSLVSIQPYVNKFEIFKPQEFKEDFVNMNDWRKSVAHTHNTTGTYNKCWSEVMSEDYHFPIPQEYKWIDVCPNDDFTRNKIVIHRSKHRHNGTFPWERILNSVQGEIIFLTTSQQEWNMFPYKHKVKLHMVSNIEQIAAAINSGKFFIGNQSAPFAIACGLDVPRLVELDSDPSKFYMDENKYSNNISWHLNNYTKFFHHNSFIKY
jgi:hypothetical protein